MFTETIVKGRRRRVLPSHPGRHMRKLLGPGYRPAWTIVDYTSHYIVKEVFICCSDSGRLCARTGPAACIANALTHK